MSTTIFHLTCCELLFQGDEETELDMATGCECLNCAIELLKQAPTSEAAKQRMLGDAHTQLAKVRLLTN